MFKINKKYWESLNDKEKDFIIKNHDKISLQELKSFIKIVKNHFQNNYNNVLFINYITVQYENDIYKYSGNDTKKLIRYSQD